MNVDVSSLVEATRERDRITNNWLNLLADHEGHTLEVMPPEDDDPEALTFPLPAMLVCETCDHLVVDILAS